MKHTAFSLLVLAGLFCTQSCTTNHQYLDPNTGEGLDLKKEEKTGLMVDAKTGEVPKLYVDTKSKDTLWGATGKVVNGNVIREKREDGVYVYIFSEPDAHKTEATYNGNEQGSEGEAYKIKNGDYKKEVEKDGDIIIKDGNKKIKIDGETGERKVKYDN